MQNQSQSALPTHKNVSSNLLAVRNQLFFHYLNHRYLDIPNSGYTSSKKVIEGIIQKFAKKYRPEKYFRNSEGSEKKISCESIDESLEDIRTIAHIAVWEATEKYICGVKKKINGKIIDIEYEKKFMFCEFASQQVNYKLRTFLRKQNLDRICGYAPDSDSIREIYTILPKIKFKKGKIYEKDFSNLADKNRKLSKEDIKSFDKFITAKTISSDKEQKDEENNSSNDCSNYLVDEIDHSNFNQDIVINENNLEVKTDKALINGEFYKLLNNFLNNLPLREKEIFYFTKLKELTLPSKNLTLSDLGKKYGISAEAIRKISEKKFREFEIFIKSNKKKLGR